MSCDSLAGGLFTGGFKDQPFGLASRLFAAWRIVNQGAIRLAIAAVRKANQVLGREMNSEKPVTATNFSTADKLAFERTRLAYERTMMAWMRTSVALITFGFGTYKLFEIVPFVTGMKPGQHVISPRAFALFLAFLGVFSLLLAAIQHRKNLQAIRALGLKIPYSGAAILAALLAVLGIAVLVVVILRL
jgi:putative membrane protein